MGQYKQPSIQLKIITFDGNNRASPFLVEVLYTAVQ